MRIAMFTNTYLPHVGGVARSIEQFSNALRKQNHEVLIIAPEFPNSQVGESHVMRVPAVENFNGSDFSVYLPVPGFLDDALDAFKPDIIHSHHPFLLGDTALRTASKYKIPLVFTHHTLYEQYTHYVTGESTGTWAKTFIMDLTSNYANACQRIIAPSNGVSQLLRDRGVTKPINTIPTGIEMDRFSHADPKNFRAKSGIPESAFLVGHVGRLAPEKNLGFLTGVLVQFLKTSATRHFLLVGSGPMENEILKTFQDEGLSRQVHNLGILRGSDLVNAYASMDVFVFASHSETQGMVLTEAMATGTPVIAIKATGVEDVVVDGENGFLLDKDDSQLLVQRLSEYEILPASARHTFRESARKTAEGFSMALSVDKLIALYSQSILENHTVPSDEGLWDSTLQRVQAEWTIWSNYLHATGVALLDLSDDYP
jgi:1,2-diacylglycerol 3-alpha-glucosyltransferase